MRPEIKLVQQIGRVKEHKVELSKNEEGRAQEIHQKSIIVDMHAHPIVLPENMDYLQEYADSLKYPTGFEGLAKSGVTACFYSNIDLKGLLKGTPWHWESALIELGYTFSEFDRNRDKVTRIFHIDDIGRAKKEGKTGIVTVLEAGGDTIGNVLDRLEVFHGMGVRCMGFTYTRRNIFGDGQLEKTNAGLSELGHALVERMNKLGVIIDLAHVGKQTSLEIIRISKDPVLITHAGMQALNPTPRMKTDEEVKVLAERGGVMGIEGAPNAISRSPRQGIKDLLNHIDYAVKLVGVDHVGIGSDTLFGDHTALHHKILEIMGLQNLLKGPLADYMKGLENISEWMNITRGLVSRGYSDQEIQKIIGLNARRVMGKVIQ